MFKKVFDWILLICLLLLALMHLIWGGFYSYGFDGWVISLFLATFDVFLACGPFRWIPFIEPDIAAFLLPIWRPSLVIIMGCYFFPPFHGGWAGWWNWLGYIAGMVTIVCGIIVLVVDLVRCCKSSCKCPEGDSGDLPGEEGAGKSKFAGKDPAKSSMGDRGAKVA